jgi:hypothetical protein
VDLVKEPQGLAVPLSCPIPPMIGALERGAVTNTSHGGMLSRMRKMIQQQFDGDYVNDYVKVILYQTCYIVIRLKNSIESSLDIIQFNLKFEFNPIQFNFDSSGRHQ